MRQFRVLMKDQELNVWKETEYVVDEDTKKAWNIAGNWNTGITLFKFVEVFNDGDHADSLIVRTNS